MNEDELLDLLALMFDAYEEGPDCYEDPDECAGHIGKAVHLDDATFDRIADILNLRRPRNVGAGGTAHDWKCISPGEYDSLYECQRCGARHMEQLDRLGSDRPRFGCTYNA